jgi:cytochrome c553
MKGHDVRAQPVIWLGFISLIGLCALLSDRQPLDAQPPIDDSPRGMPMETDQSSDRTAAAIRDFRYFCTRCHGDDFTGGEMRNAGWHIPNFTDGLWQNNHSDAKLIESIKDGKGSRMPAFDDRLNDEQMRNLVRLIRRQGRAPSRTASPGANRNPVTQTDPTEFEQKFNELKKELAALQQQFHELANNPGKSAVPKRRIQQPAPSTRREL